VGTMTAKVKNDQGQRRTRTRSALHAARTAKGHPMREARRRRAAERLAVHAYNPERCGPNCPKRKAAAA
jgi:hypothetical protein